MNDKNETKKKRRSGLFSGAASGQALIIVAVGFIGLLGFVGIVTDVSLLFVRYSTLRRAVDAAAVAAAGQLRRVDDPTPNDNIAEGEASSIANLNLAARTFIEFYGLNPERVLVETCRVQNVPRNPDGSPNLTDPLVAESYNQLCTSDELKLVRVTAQLESPTVFFRLFGYDTVTLTESALSQTAVIDVVLVFDVSESMLSDTTYRDWETIGQGVRYIPTQMNYNMPPHAAIDPVIIGLPEYGYTNLGLYVNEMLTNTQQSLLTMPGHTPIQFIPTGVAPQVEPREACRVRGFPYSGIVNVAMPENYENEVRAYMGASFDTHFADGNAFIGYVPQYNFYGCCNDPNGDFLFNDLICQPFKQARDAAEEFLARLDFLRGDRVAFVTFDRRATLIDPDGNGPQIPMIETQFNIETGVTADRRRGAVETLRATLGVRSETSFYADTNLDGYWDAFRSNGSAVSWDDYHSIRTISDPNNYDQPVNRNCPFDAAATIGIYAGDASISRESTRLFSVITFPAWMGIDPPLNRSYEYRASCSGTNIGAGLRQGSGAFSEFGRQEGAVWIMVLLSDGAAGASNAVARTDASAPGGASLYNEADPYASPIAESGEYGGLGLCPYGNATHPSRLATSDNFPYCSDLQPETRHFCGSIQAEPDSRRMDVTCSDFGNINATTSELIYDVDDYARDWADYIGLANLPGSDNGLGEQLLPTIFSIGFGLTYENLADPGCTLGTDDCLRAANPEVYLGEELLRYIGDVGDNNQIDDDYWQSQLGNRIPNTAPNFEGRGPCERSFPGAPFVQGQDYMPIAPGESCGNYFNAQDGAALQRVFNEIASRMFTRLSQ